MTDLDRHEDYDSHGPLEPEQIRAIGTAEPPLQETSLKKEEVMGFVDNQLLPDLPSWQYSALKASIQRWGVLVPVVKDDLGLTIDGLQRERACRELGISNYPVILLKGLTAEDKRDHALILNLVRRSLSRRQMRQLIAVELRRTPDLASNYLAEILGTSDKTVELVRQNLIETSEIPKLEKLRGKDGKQRRVTRIIANNSKELEKAKEIIKDLPENCFGKTFDVKSAKRIAARRKNEEEREGRIMTPLATDSIQLFHCPFQDLEKVARIKPATVNLLLSDIPYAQEFLPQVAELGELAARVLVEGGLFVCMVGQYWLHKVMYSLNQALTYRWEAACVWEGEGVPVHLGGWKCPHGRVISKWKPLLVYSKGAYTRKGQWCDVYPVKGIEKDWHRWQQPLDLFERLVRDFSNPGDLVIDPCGGSFTTPEACLRQNRRCISCDIQKTCVLRGQERLQQAQQQLKRAL